MKDINLGQRYSTISFAASPELKLELYQTAVNSGVSLSHYVEILVEKGLIFDKKFSELQAENEALRKQIAELQSNNPETASEAVSKLQTENEALRKQIAELQNNKPANPELENSLLQEISTLKDSLCDHRKAIAELKKYALIKYLNERFAFYVIDELARQLAQNINKNTNPKQFLQVFDEAISEMLTPEKQKVFRQMKANEFLPEFEGEILQIEKQTILKNEHIQTDLQDICPIDTQADTLNKNSLDGEFTKALPKPEPINEPTNEPTDKEKEYQPKGKNEKILHELYTKGVDYITRIELKELGFDTGFFSKLDARGGIYGKYKLEKAPSDKVFRLILNPKHHNNAQKDTE